MLDRLRLPALPTLTGECVILRGPRDSDVDDRLRHPVDPEEEDGYGSSWRREWDGRRYHTREHLTADRKQPGPGTYNVGGRARRPLHRHRGVARGCRSALRDLHGGLFVAGLRGQGLGSEITRLVLSWAFGELGAHRVELQVLASNARAVNCYLACGFRQEGTRREAELYPDGWKDFIVMGLLQSEYASRP